MNEMTDTFFTLLGAVLIGVVFLSPPILTATWFADRSNKAPTNQLNADRLEDNLEILKKLKKYVEDNPSQRFGQVLRNCGIINDIGVRDSSKSEWETPDYYIDRQVIFEEPDVILRRMKNTLANKYKSDIVIKEVKK